MKSLSVFSLLFLFAIASCSRVPVLDDLSSPSFNMINQDGEEVIFPDDFKGKYMVLGFIYINCPDVCPMITQNMKNVQNQLGNPDDVQFVAVTFDPERDTPEELKKYKDMFKLDTNFNFLTADTTTMSAFLDSVRVRTQISFTTESDTGEELYFINHSNKIMVLNRKAQLIYEYGGSMTNPNMITEDIKKVL